MLYYSISTYTLQFEVLFWAIIVAVIFANCYIIRLQNVLFFPVMLIWSHAGDRLIQKPEILCSVASDCKNCLQQDVRYELA